MEAEPPPGGWEERGTVAPRWELQVLHGCLRYFVSASRIFVLLAKEKELSLRKG